MDATRRRELLGTFERLLDVDGRGVDQLDVTELRRLGARSLAVRSWLDAFDTTLAAAARARSTPTAPVDAGGVVSGGGRRSRSESDKITERVDACATVPGIGEALATGEVAAGHVDAVSAATRNLSDAAKERFGEHADELIEHARLDTPEEFARRCRRLGSRVADEDEKLRTQERLRRQRKVSRWTDRDGMCHTKLSLDPLADQTVWTAIEAMIAAARGHNQQHDDRTFDQLRADAVVDLLTRTGPSGELARVPEVCVHIDLDTLLGRAVDAGLCETSDGKALPVETVRRLCCEGRIIPIVLDGASVPLDHGRAQRLATPAQRRALRAIYTTCGFTGCKVPFDRCRIHHVSFWEHFGPTDLENMFPACDRHHHLVHEGGWTLTLDATRLATWTSPDGLTVLHSRPDRIPTVLAAAASAAVTQRAGSQVGESQVGESQRDGAQVGVSPRAGAQMAGSDVAVSQRAGTQLAGSDVAVSQRAGAHIVGSDVAVSQMAAAIERRRQRQAASDAGLAGSRGGSREGEPIPLFADERTVSRRGPPTAS